MYDWRRLSQSDRHEVLKERKRKNRPWHSPPRRHGPGQYILTGACYEHEPHIAASRERLDAFSSELLSTLANVRLYAWCVLPNHYHVVVGVTRLDPVVHALGRLHGRTSYDWNGEEERRGRKVWYSCTDRQMRSYSHLMTSINYVHHNPVKHKYVAHWQDWPWTSAHEYLLSVGREEATRVWHAYPLLDYGNGWDD
jgi:putative transposase